MEETFLSVEDREERCYNYFNKYEIENRVDLREKLKQHPLDGVRINFIEDILSDFLLKKRFEEKRKNEIQTSTDLKTVFVLGDIHIPFHDEESLRNVFDCVVDNQPNYIVLLGDVLDCYSISRFLKRPDRARNLQDEINIFYKLFRGLKKQLKNTEIHYIFGNHEARLEKLILENPGLFKLKALAPERLFRLEELGIYFHRTKFKLNNFTYYHGDVVRKDSSYSAKAEYLEHRMNCGISGHVHRLGSYYTTYEKETNAWFENGCLCKIDPDYINDPDKANWQHGFTVVNSFDGLNLGTQIMINNHKFVYNGRIYK